MNTKKSLLVKILLLIIIQSSMFGATYYVATDGLRTNDGSISSPWDIQTGFNSLRNGDTLYLRGGTYALTGNAPALYMGNIGTSNPPTQPSEGRTVKNYQDEIPILDAKNVYWANNNNPDGKPGSGNDRGIWVEGVISAVSEQQSYSVIDGIHIINVIDPVPDTIYEFNKVGITVGSGANNCIVKNCYTYNTCSSGIYIGGENQTIDANEVELFTTHGNQEGITAYGTTSVTISNNYVHDMGNYNGHHNGIAIDVKDGGDNAKVFGNRIHNSKLVGIYLDVRGQAKGVEIYNNYIYNVGTVQETYNGIVLSNEQPAANDVIEGAKIYNNIIIDQLSKGIAIGWSLASGNPVQNASIVNNVLYGNSIGIACDTTKGVGKVAENIVISNNILTNNSTQISLYHENVDETQFTIDTNIIIGNTGTRFTNYTNNFSSDPLFTDAFNGDFRIKKESPAFKAGSLKYLVPNIDFDGNIRDKENGVTIGAFEYLNPTHTSTTFIIRRENSTLTPLTQ